MKSFKKVIMIVLIIIVLLSSNTENKDLIFCFKNNTPEKSEVTPEYSELVDKIGEKETTKQDVEDNYPDEETLEYNEGILYDFFLTYDEIIALKNVNFNEKLAALKIVSKINSGDFEKILRLADGGITYEEKIEADRILRKSISEEDIKKVYGIIFKYKE